MSARNIILVVSALVMGAFAGCGGGGDGGQSSGGPASVRVQETAGVAAAFVQYGIDRGFFKKHDLHVNLKTATGGATTIPAVLSGSVDIGGSNLITIEIAAAKGLPVRLVAPGVFATKEKGESSASVLVPADSDIKSQRDLAGKTIAVNTLNNIADVTVKTALKRHGIDPESVHFTELDFPEMPAALSSGRVDAAFVIEPFETLALKQGARPVMHPYEETRAGLQIAGYITSTRYAQENPEVVKRYQAALADNARAIAADPEAFRRFSVKVTKVPPAIADKVSVPTWKTRSDRDSFDLLGRSMVDFGLIKKQPNFDKLSLER